MKRSKSISPLFWMFVVVVSVLITSCSSNPASSGLEYMPDMYRSPAIEAYVDYGVIQDVEYDSLTQLMSARIPAEGTIVYQEKGDDVIFNMPYPYKKDEYELAGKEWRSPLPYTKENAAEGEYVYQRFCTHCHGEDGGGQGSLIKTGKYPSPGSYASKDITEGHMYHTIVYGKGVMGSHASQISVKERWQVIQHVKKLKNGGTYPIDSVAVQSDSTDISMLE